MLSTWLGFAIFAGGFIVSITALIITVVPALPRIRAALRGEPSPETAAQHWRRIHAAADRGRPLR